jgi:hypothetical protein
MFLFSIYTDVETSKKST